MSHCFFSSLPPTSPWKLAYVQRVKGDRIGGRNEIIDTRTGDRYRDDKQSEVSAKCFNLFLFTPFYLVGTICFNLAELPIKALYVEEKTCAKTGSLLVDGKVKRAFYKVSKGTFYKTPKSILLSLSNIIRAPYYAWDFELAVMFGIFFPYDGRKAAAQIEKKWNRNVSYKNDIRKGKASLWDKKKPMTVYAAYCFQSIGNIHDAKVHDVEYLDEQL